MGRFAAEHALFALALLLLIPPARSHPSHTISFFPLVALLVGASVFASRVVALRRQETWAGAATKTVIILVFGAVYTYVLNQYY